MLRFARSTNASYFVTVCSNGDETDIPKRPELKKKFIKLLIAPNNGWQAVAVQMDALEYVRLVP